MFCTALDQKTEGAINGEARFAVSSTSNVEGDPPHFPSENTNQSYELYQRSSCKNYQILFADLVRRDRRLSTSIENNRLSPYRGG